MVTVLPIGEGYRTRLTGLLGRLFIFNREGFRKVKPAVIIVEMLKDNAAPRRPLLKIMTLAEFITLSSGEKRSKT